MSSQIIQELHKDTVKTLVTKILRVYTLLLVALDFSLDRRWGVVLALSLATAGFNIYMDTRRLSFGLFGKKIDLSQDQTDAFRWLINICLFDFLLTLFLNNHSGILNGFWTIVVISIAAETFDRRFRYPLMILAIALGGFGLWYTEEIPLTRLAMFVVNIGAVASFFVGLESFYLQLSAKKITADLALEKAGVATEALYKKALAGDHARNMSHEVGNIMMVVELLFAKEEGQKFQSLQASLSYLRRLIKALIDDLYLEDVRHETSLETLLSDVRVMILRQAERKKIRCETEGHDQVGSPLFSETSGSTFLILQNIIKNTMESLERAYKNPGDRHIRLSIASRDGRVQITVIDNGRGLTDDIIARLKNGSAETTKAGGHGIGMKFVRNECRKNGFDLLIERTSEGGAAIGISIPVLRAEKKAA
jgi:signal transduction histidine kinase